MPKLQGSQTERNLLVAFAGESQADRKYLAFAKRAEEEGHLQVAKLFRAAAEAETVHAHAHLRVLGGVGDTAANLKAAIGGETHEFTTMYPDMIRQATREGFDTALKSFTFANAVEKLHAELYQRALDTLGKNAPADYYVCQVCGNTLQAAPDGPCAICGSGRSAFRQID
jgi:rubrerythrin